MREGGRRAKRVSAWVDDNYRLVILALVVVGVAGGYTAYTAYGTTETVVRERTVSTATTFSEFSHGATVREDSAVFSQGVRLAGRSLYFTQLSPVLNGTYRLRHGGEDPVPARARADARLVLRSVGSGDTVYWSDSEPLGSVNESSLEPGEPMAANFSVNVTASLASIGRIRENLSASPGSAEVAVVVSSVVEGETGGERYVDMREETMTVSPGRGTYSVGADTEGRKVHEAEETVVIEKEGSNTPVYGGASVFVLSVVSSALLEKKRREGFFSVPEEEVQNAAFRADRERFDEWISRGSVEGQGTDRTVRVSSLADVVDAAIDTDRRVIETEEGETYVVLAGETKYVYERGTDDG